MPTDDLPVYPTPQQASYVKASPSAGSAQGGGSSNYPGPRKYSGSTPYKAAKQYQQPIPVQQSHSQSSQHSQHYQMPAQNQYSSAPPQQYYQQQQAPQGQMYHPNQQQPQHQSPPNQYQSTHYQQPQQQQPPPQQYYQPQPPPQQYNQRNDPQQQPQQHYQQPPQNQQHHQQQVSTPPLQYSTPSNMHKKPPAEVPTPPKQPVSSRKESYAESTTTTASKAATKQKLEQELRSVFGKVDTNHSGRISPSELSQALLNFDSTRFRDSTVLLMVKLFSSSSDVAAAPVKSLNFEQFVSLWKYLSAYKKLFGQADTNKSGDISFGEFQKILETIGYKLNIDLILNLFQKFSASDGSGVGKLKFDAFIELLVYLRKLTDIFKKYDKDLSGVATISFSDFLFEVSSIT